MSECAYLTLHSALRDPSTSVSPRQFSSIQLGKTETTLTSTWPSCWSFQNTFASPAETLAALASVATQPCSLRFLAATPKHPVILESLKEFKRWYDQLNRPGINQDDGPNGARISCHVIPKTTTDKLEGWCAARWKVWFRVRFRVHHFGNGSRLRDVCWVSVYRCPLVRWCEFGRP